VDRASQDNLRIAFDHRRACVRQTAEQTNPERRMHDETEPVQNQEWHQPPADPEPVVTTLHGRTPGRASAIRAGLVVGSALVVIVGAAVAMGASPAPGSSGGAQPSAAAGAQGDGNRNGNGFGRPFWFGAGGPAAGLPGDLGNGKGDRVGGRAFGPITITAIAGSSVSLKTEDGWTRTITVTADTSITRGGEKAALSDLKVGDTIRLGQKRNSDGSWTVTAIAVVLPTTAGTVTAVGADTITITGRDGTSQTVRTTGSTTYHLGKADGTRADVKVGTMIVAVGDRGADGSLTATGVRVFLPRVAGTVTAVTSDSLTITRRDGTTMTIHVGSGTSIGVAGVDKATLADVKAGMVVVVEGSQRADGSLDATALRAGKVGKGLGEGRDGPKAPDASGAPSTTG
jgi:hypothetical protein